MLMLVNLRSNAKCVGTLLSNSVDHYAAEFVCLAHKPRETTWKWTELKLSFRRGTHQFCVSRPIRKSRTYHSEAASYIARFEVWRSELNLGAGYVVDIQELYLTL